jgi:hypothetical protein
MNFFSVSGVLDAYAIKVKNYESTYQETITAIFVSTSGIVDACN